MLRYALVEDATNRARNVVKFKDAAAVAAYQTPAGHSLIAAIDRVEPGWLWDGAGFAPDPAAEAAKEKAAGRADLATVDAEAGALLEELLAVLDALAILPAASRGGVIAAWLARRAAAKTRAGL